MLLGSSPFRPLWVVVVSLLLAGAMNIFPMGWLWGYFQPDWLALVVIYWCLWEPERMSSGLGSISGLFLDILDYSVIGKNMLAKTAIAFFSNKLSLRLRAYPLWQQCVGVGLLVGVDTLIVALVQYLLGESMPSPGRWMTPLASMLMWPLVVMVLHGTRRRRSYMG